MDVPLLNRGGKTAILKGCHFVQVISLLYNALLQKSLTMSASEFLESKISTLPMLPFCTMFPSVQVRHK